MSHARARAHTERRCASSSMLLHNDVPWFSSVAHLVSCPRELFCTHACTDIEVLHGERSTSSADPTTSNAGRVETRTQRNAHCRRHFIPPTMFTTRWARVQLRE
jgi:hypothetical protein